MQSWLLALLPLLGAPIGYFLKRWLERRSATEALKRKLQVLELHQGMQRSGLSLQEIERLERQVARPHR